MRLKEEFKSEVENIFREKWDARDGRGIPGVQKFLLGSDIEIKLTGTVLYAGYRWIDQNSRLQRRCHSR